jgi:hypothetical protein
MSEKSVFKQQVYMPSHQPTAQQHFALPPPPATQDTQARLTVEQLPTADIQLVRSLRAGARLRARAPLGSAGVGCCRGTAPPVVVRRRQLPQRSSHAIPHSHSARTRHPQPVRAARHDGRRTDSERERRVVGWGATSCCRTVASTPVDYRARRSSSGSRAR